MCCGGVFYEKIETMDVEAPTAVCQCIYACLFHMVFSAGEIRTAGFDDSHKAG